MPRPAAKFIMAAGILAALLGLPPTAAEAQTVTTLVSNTGAADSGGRSPNRRDMYAQAFTTGGHAAGYSLASVGVHVRSLTNFNTGSPVVVTLRADSLSDPGDPGTIFATLTSPASYTAGLNTFTAPANTTLAANTTYHVVVGQENGGTGTNGFNWTRVLISAGLDARAAAGWRIDSGYRVGNDMRGWALGDTSRALKIQVRGHAVGVSNTAAVGTPTISGTAKVDEELTAVPGTITDAEGGVPTTAAGFTYRWERESPTDTWNAIPGADSVAYTLVRDDQGGRVRVVVSFTDGGGTLEELTSDPTAAVARRDNSEATGTPVILGPLVVGQDLTVETLDIMDGNELGTLSYQWRRADNASGGGAENIGADSATYTLQSGDSGKHVQVVVSFTDGDGYPESRSSAWTTAAVAAAGTPLSVVTVTADSANVVGGSANPVVFTLTRTEPTANALRVTIAITGDPSATVGARPTTADFEAGSTTTRVTVQSSSQEPGDSLDVTLTVRDGTGYTLGTPAMATVAVTGLPLPEITVAAAKTTVPASDGNVVFVFTQMGSTTTFITVPFSIMDADGVLASTPRTAAVGTNTEYRVSIPIVNAPTGSATSSVTLTVTPRSSAYTVGEPSTATVTVTAAALAPAPTPPTVTVAAKTGGASVVGGNDAVFTLTRSTSSAAALQVTFAITGTHTVSSPPTTATIPATMTTVDVSITTTAVTGAPQTVILTVTAPGDSTYTVGTANMATVTVTAPALSSATTDMVREVSAGVAGRALVTSVAGVVRGRLQAPRGFAPISQAQLLDTVNLRALGGIGKVADLKHLLSGSEFAYALAAAGDGAPETDTWEVWGRGSWRRLSGEDGPLNWDGNQYGFHVGLDRQREDLLMGVMLGYHQGALRLGGQGDLDSYLLSVHPYLALNLTRHFQVWAALGYGAGDVEGTTVQAGKEDLSLWTGTVGLEGRVESEGGTDAVVSGFASVASTAESEGDTRVYLLGIEAQLGHRLALEESTARPFLLVAGRHDAGDLESGTALEVGGGLEWSLPGSGISVSLRGRTQVNSTANEEHGASGELRYDLHEDGLGLQLSLVPQLGGVTRMQLDPTQPVSHVSPVRAGGAGLVSELGYGLATGRGLLRPHGRVELAESLHRLELGVRLESRSGLDLELDLERSVVPGSDVGADHAGMVNTRLRF